MGVTYKLKDEIINFIIQQKRENPQISCRKLVIILEENFQVHVSKSSVNAILKDAHLSSPVGRTPSDLDRIKKFSIPHEKKVQLFGPLLNTEAPDVKPAEKIIPKDKPKITPPNKESQNTESIQVAESKKVEKNASSFNSEAIDTEQSTQLNIRTEASSESQEQQWRQCEITKMESFFLRVASRDFFGRNILEDFFNANTTLSPREIQIIDVLFCLVPSVLDDSSIALDKKNLWPWLLNDWDTPPSIDEIEKIIEYLKNTKISRSKFFLELSYFFTFINSVNFEFNDGKQCVVDGRMKILSEKPDSFIPVPIERSIDQVSRFISGNDDLILSCAEPEMAPEVLKKVVNLCEGKDNTVKTIILEGLDKNQILKFSKGPNRSHNFILKVQMSPRQFEEIFKKSLKFVPEKKVNREGCHLMYVDEPFSIISERTDLTELRIIAFYDMETGLADICISNISPKVRSIEQFESKHLIKQCFGRIIEPLKIHVSDNNQESEIILAEGLRKLKDLIVQYIAFCTKIFEMEDVFVSICNQEAYANFNKNNVKVSIKLKEGSDSSKYAPILDALSFYFSIIYIGKKISYIY